MIKDRIAAEDSEFQQTGLVRMKRKWHSQAYPAIRDEAE